jgi:pimeloyl-ACP methyl ester carboxylesterase
VDFQSASAKHGGRTVLDTPPATFLSGPVPDLASRAPLYDHEPDLDQKGADSEREIPTDRPHPACARSGSRPSTTLRPNNWGAAVGAVYALRFGDSVDRLAFLESSLAGAGFEQLWNFSTRNAALSFVPFLLMGEIDSPGDSTADLITGRETIYLEHLWATFTVDKAAAPFAAWAPYVSAMARPGVATSSSKYYREAYRSAEQVQRLVARKLELPVLAISGEKALGSNQEQLVRAFALNVEVLIVSGAGHFLAEERPDEIGAALRGFLAK